MINGVGRRHDPLRYNSITTWWAVLVPMAGRPEETILGTAAPSMDSSIEPSCSEHSGPCTSRFHETCLPWECSDRMGGRAERTPKGPGPGTALV